MRFFFVKVLNIISSRIILALLVYQTTAQKWTTDLKNQRKTEKLFRLRNDSFIALAN